MLLELRMAYNETIGKRRCAHRTTVEPSKIPVRQDSRVLHVAHGQGVGRRTRSSSGFVLGRKRSKSSGE